MKKKLSYTKIRSSSEKLLLFLGITFFISTSGLSHGAEQGTLAEASPNPNELSMALLDAAYKGQYDDVTLLLRNGADPNTSDPDGYTPLYAAVARGHYNVTYLLLRNGANPNASVHGGFTPLHVSVYNKNIEILELLLEFGASPLAKPLNIETPLWGAFHLGFTRGFDLMGLYTPDAEIEEIINMNLNTQFAERVLCDMGYYPRRVMSGIKNDADLLKKAIITFEKSNGLPISGKLTEDVLRYLWIFDPSARRQDVKEYFFEKFGCYVCSTRIWRISKDKVIISGGGCSAPPEIVKEHVVRLDNVVGSLPSGGMYMLWMPLGNHCRRPEGGKLR